MRKSNGATLSFSWYHTSDAYCTHLIRLRSYDFYHPDPELFDWVSECSWTSSRSSISFKKTAPNQFQSIQKLWISLRFVSFAVLKTLRRSKPSQNLHNILIWKNIKTLSINFNSIPTTTKCFKCRYDSQTV